MLVTGDKAQAQQGEQRRRREKEEDKV